MLLAFDGAFLEGQDILGNVLSGTVPGWLPGSVVELHHTEATEVFERVLTNLETQLHGLCSRHDARALFLTSRLCAALPNYRAAERSLEATQMRIRAADVWAITHGRCYGGDVLCTGDFDPWSIGRTLGGLGDETFADSVMLHFLVGVHRRMVVHLVRTNYLRLYSATNNVPGPRVRFDGRGDVQVLAPIRDAEDAADLFGHRYTYNRAFSWWGFADDEKGEGAGVMTMKEVKSLAAGPFGGGVVFAPDRFSLSSLAEIGGRFRELFVQALGMPAEHLVSILLALSIVGVGTTPAENEIFKQWGMPAGAVPVPREDFLPGGRLEAAAREMMRQNFPDLIRDQESSGGSLARSVGRFTDLARPPVGESYGKNTGLNHPERALWLPYLILGGEDDDVWLVDFAASIPFVQSLVDQLEVSEGAATTGTGRHDAYERTSLFDLALWRGVQEIRGVKAALPVLRPDPALPNVESPLSGSGNHQELDVPLRVGDVLVAVQTWARGVDKRVEEGDHAALQARWNSVRRKRSSTDRNYARRLIDDPEARKILRAKNLRYILPILCSPLAEPVASAERRYWLRHPSDLPPGRVPLALPRVLTPPELQGFLDDTSERELKKICKDNGWKL